MSGFATHSEERVHTSVAGQSTARAAGELKKNKKQKYLRSRVEKWQKWEGLGVLCELNN